MIKIVLSNWINILIVLLAVFIYAVIANYSYNNYTNYTILQAMLAAAIVVVLYGMLPWLLFVLLLVVCDILLIRKYNISIIMFLLEWCIVSLPFIYWTIKYQEWIFIVGVAGFLISQMLRYRKLKVKLNDKHIRA